MNHTKLPWHAKLEHFSDAGEWTAAEIWSEWESPEPHIIATLAARSTMNANALHIAECVNTHESLTRQNEALREALGVARANLQFLPPDDVVAQIDAALEAK